MRKIFAVIAIALLSALPIRATEAEDQKEEEIYQKATSALDAERWTAAIAGFRQIAKANGPRADRAVYWMAHAQFKAGRAADALASLQDLKSRFPKSQWLDDAAAMEVEIRESSGQPVAPEAINDEELKLIAISSLMGSEPERAVALIEKILAKKGSAAMKERALFVLGQLHSPRARQVLESYARNGADGETQRYAIRAIAVSGKRHSALLADIYRQSASKDTKRTVIEALMVAGDKAQLLEVAESDPDAGMRGEAANKLGILKATAELQRLYAKEASREVKDSIIQGLFLGGDVETLARLARTEPDADLRKSAIRGLGMISGKRSHDVLMEIWNRETSAEAKEGVIEALFIRGDAKTLVAFARKETDRHLRRELVQKLSVMSSKEAREYMLELLDK